MIGICNNGVRPKCVCIKGTDQRSAEGFSYTPIAR